MRVLVVDNGGQWTHREWRVLKYLGVDTEIIPNTTPPEEITADGLVLSGGAPRIGSEDLDLGRTGDYLDQLDIPMLGICVGAQYIAMHFKGTVGTAEIPEFGKTSMTITEHDELFKDIPADLEVWESHNDEIKELPEGFINLAHSDNCSVQAFRHKDRPIFGLQFHPEVEHTQNGSDMFKNFLRVCEK